eukprot:293771-Rhodomonas_salina.1
MMTAILAAASGCLGSSRCQRPDRSVRTLATTDTRNQRQETAFLVQTVLKMRFLALCFGVYNGQVVARDEAMAMSEASAKATALLQDDLNAQLRSLRADLQLQLDLNLRLSPPETREAGQLAHAGAPFSPSLSSPSPFPPSPSDGDGITAPKRSSLQPPSLISPSPDISLSGFLASLPRSYRSAPSSAPRASSPPLALHHLRRSASPGQGPSSS